MPEDRYREFCINESVRIGRFAAKLEEYGKSARAAEMRAIAAKFDALSKEAVS